MQMHYACAGIHACQRITIAGNNVWSSPPYTILHAGLSIHCTTADDVLFIHTSLVIE